MLQLPLPAGWARDVSSRRDPVEQLDAIAKDKIDARAAIRQVLDGLAAKHGVSPGAINAAVRAYADDMIGDMLYDVERELTHEIEAREQD